MHYNIIIKVICIRFHVHQNIFTLCYNFMCMKKHIFQNLVLSAALLAGCAGNASPAAPAVQTFQNVTIDSGFDTVITLVEQTSDQEAFQAHYDTMCEQFSHYNSLFDIYNTYEGIASLKTINDSAGIAPVAVSEEVIDMLEQAKEICELSDGAFDITMGSLLQVWHRYREDGLAANEQGKRGSLPDPAELETAASHRGFDMSSSTARRVRYLSTMPRYHWMPAVLRKDFPQNAQPAFSNRTAPCMRPSTPAETTARSAQKPTAARGTSGFRTPTVREACLWCVLPAQTAS